MRRCLLLIAVGLSLLPGLVLHAADDATEALPSNLGYSLRQLIVWHRAQPGVLSAAGRRARLAEQLPARARRWQTNADVGQAIVKVALDGSLPAAEVRANLTALGLEILAEDAPRAGDAVFSARLPLDSAERVAGLPGVRSVALVHRPWKRAGKVTTQGTFVLGFYGSVSPKGGTGITVGIISDSFDAATLDLQGNPLTDHAADDIASGDLPGPGNPDGDTTPVAVLADANPADTANTDEGRAMLQIVHDLAPAATLAFSASGSTPETLAASIRALRTNATAPCDIIADDLTYPEEPMFYDGPAAQAVYDVTHDATLPGHKVFYYSAAGNSGDLGYVADFNPVLPNSTATGPLKGNLRLDQVPGKLLLDGLHNFDTRPGKVNVAQAVQVAGGDAEIDLQWDSAPGQTGVSAADFNLLVFDAAGNYLPDLSGKDKNIVMGNSLELVDLPAGDQGAEVTYQLVIACASRTPVGGASHLRYVVNTDGTFTAKFAGHNAPTIFGHAAAVGADAVATYDAEGRVPESYTSLGPVTILFDRDGNAQDPEVRQQPTLAAVDGVNNTFFGYADTDGDGYPNFFGTSAAAPHAAGCAALLLQSAGGSDTLTNQQARALLQGAAAAHLIDPNVAAFTATATDATGAVVTLAEERDDINPANLKNFFRLSFTGQDSQRLRRVVITVNQSGLTFDESPAGMPFAVGAVGGGLQKNDVTATLGSAYAPGSAGAAKFQNQLTLTFAPDAFGPGASMAFGLGIKNLSYDTQGLDPLGWAMLDTGLTARLAGDDGKTKVATTGNAVGGNYGTGYSPVVGSGLINVGKAIANLEADGPPATPDSRAGLLPGDVVLTTNDGRVVETTPGGKIVQEFSVADARASTVLDDGNVGVLCESPTGPYLTILDPLTGATTTTTYPGWQEPTEAYTSNQIVSQGNAVFVLNTGAPQSQGGEGTMILRYDSVNDAWQSFASTAGTSGPQTYGSLIAGLDGLLYVSVRQNLFSNLPTEVYDPNTLQLLRTVPSLPPTTPGYPSFPGQVPPAAVDAAGNIYVLESAGGSEEGETVVKYAPDGTQLAVLSPSLLGRAIIYSFANLEVTPGGEVFLTVDGGFVVVDATLDKVTEYTAPAATLALVQP